MISDVVRVDNKLAVTFTSNDEMAAAYKALKANLPTGWRARGRVEWILFPHDDDYGDILSGGFMGCHYGLPLISDDLMVMKGFGEFRCVKAEEVK